MGSHDDFSPLPIPPRALARILAQEGTPLWAAQEAIRRMLANPTFRAGQVRSPAAFYRAILRHVLEELPPPPTP